LHLKEKHCKSGEFLSFVSFAEFFWNIETQLNSTQTHKKTHECPAFD
jgi:hypothetical protein